MPTQTKGRGIVVGGAVALRSFGWTKLCNDDIDVGVSKPNLPCLNVIQVIVWRRVFCKGQTTFIELVYHSCISYITQNKADIHPSCTVFVYV